MIAGVVTQDLAGFLSAKSEFTLYYMNLKEGRVFEDKCIECCEEEFNQVYTMFLRLQDNRREAGWTFEELGQPTEYFKVIKTDLETNTQFSISVSLIREL